MIKQWERVTVHRHPEDEVHTGSWQDFATLTFLEWCKRHGRFMLRNRRNLDTMIETSENGKIALYVQRYA